MPCKSCQRVNFEIKDTRTGNFTGSLIKTTPIC